MPSATSLQDLADHLKLSRATVSLALSGKGSISPVTGQRVICAAPLIAF